MFVLAAAMHSMGLHSALAIKRQRKRRDEQRKARERRYSQQSNESGLGESNSSFVSPRSSVRGRRRHHSSNVPDSMVENKMMSSVGMLHIGVVFLVLGGFLLGSGLLPDDITSWSQFHTTLWWNELTIAGGLGEIESTLPRSNDGLGSRRMCVDLCVFDMQDDWGDARSGRAPRKTQATEARQVALQPGAADSAHYLRLAWENSRVPRCGLAIFSYRLANKGVGAAPCRGVAAPRRHPGDRRLSAAHPQCGREPAPLPSAGRRGRHAHLRHPAGRAPLLRAALAAAPPTRNGRNRAGPRWLAEPLQR
ncbi:hypothetical protein FOCC_FOCC013220 [Frankliniella occidentalis]|nr:hypothetical protein FOCC_FOCC013220 [Frankliniella occidentalis]